MQRTDSRIKVHNNDHFLRAVPNHNLALRQISPDSKYCKIVFADDWIFPQCLEQMVAVAEGTSVCRNCRSLRSAGSRGWRFAKHEMVWTGLPFPNNCSPVAKYAVYSFSREHTFSAPRPRSSIAQILFEVGAPSITSQISTLIWRHSVVLLKNCDFGFVHQILTFKRWRPESLGTLTADLYTTIAGHLYNLVTHGPDF